MFHLAIYNQHSPWQFPRGFSWGGSTNIPGEGHDVNLRSVWCSFFHSGRLKSVYFILKLESIFVDNMKSFNKIKWQLHWQKDKDKLSDQNSKAKLKTNLVDGETAVATVPLSTLKGGAFDNLVPFWFCWKPSTWTRCCWGCPGGPSSLVLAFPAAKHILDITTNPNITRLSFKCRLGKVPKKKNTIIFFWKWTIDAWNKFYTWSHLNIFIIASVISVYICPK